MSDLKLPMSCEQFENFVSDYIDGALSSGDRAVMDAHAAQCSSCQVLLAEVRTIVADAATLAALSPSRDLWNGIAERLDTPVLSIGSASAAPVNRARTVSFRMFAAAAALLVSVSSGVTYVVTRGSSGSASPTATVATAPGPTNAAPVVAAIAGTPAAKLNADSLPTGGADAATVSNGRTPVTTSSGTGTRPNARFASRVENSTDFAYEREITAMRRIVDERLGDLDSVTVVEIERNLRIIDKAINDSRRALQNDPRSRFLSRQLDRALETKLDIMRRIALL